MVFPIIFIVIIIAMPFIIGGIQNTIERMLKPALKNYVPPHLSLTLRIFLMVLSIVGISFLVSQSVQFYLFNGSYFWLALLSFGIYLCYFFLPYLSLVIFWKSSSFLSQIGVGFVGFWTILLTKAKPIIYLDEAGISHRPANIKLQILAIVLGVGLYLFFTVSQTIKNDFTSHGMWNSIVKKVVLTKNIKSSIVIFWDKKKGILPITRIRQAVLLLVAICPLMLVLLAWAIGIVTIGSITFLLGFTLVVSITSLSNWLTIKNTWVNFCRYFIYSLVYLLISIILSAMPVPSLTTVLNHLDSFTLASLLFPISIHSAMVIPLFYKVVQYSKNRTRSK